MLAYDPYGPEGVKAERLIKRSRSDSLKIKISNKYMREKPTNTRIIHSIY
jgi:hypothetical protein